MSSQENVAKSTSPYMKHGQVSNYSCDLWEWQQVNIWRMGVSLSAIKCITFTSLFLGHRFFVFSLFLHLYLQICDTKLPKIQKELTHNKFSKAV